MTRFTLTTAAALALTSTAAFAGETQTSAVMTHPSQGDVTVVENASSMISRVEDGIFATFNTVGLTPGHVHTMWFVTMNDPSLCENDGKCTSKDVLKRSEIVSADAGFGGGVIVAEDGTASFNWYQAEGPLSGGWFGNGLRSSETTEVHLAINDHGPVLPGREFEMLNSYRDGCTDESIPAPMPATARAQGEAGPNQCRLVQFTIFTVPGGNS
ncbi:MAG: hypothetical protein GKR98_10845 [Boseongicola sp.]|nr:MAG: hypothetical protein GKR98_10845 [Boseongicola sp.]